MSDMKYPRKWQHKETKKILRVMPWWEIPEPVLDAVVMKELTNGISCKFGMLVQVGWLLENEHNVWFGLGPKAADSFDDIGEYERAVEPDAKEPTE